MLRLTIIDIEGGKQPICNEDAILVVACNGEIYKNLELTKCRCSVRALLTLVES
jgi:asparagine synthetase B (glutamine-hydrolysing)